MRRRFKRWKRWRETNLNGRIYQFFVLLGIAHSPTFGHDGWMFEEAERWTWKEEKHGEF